MPRFLYIIFIVFFFNFPALFSYTDESTDNKQPSIRKLILADVSFGPGINSLSKNKAEAALSLAARLTMKYELIPVYVSDSVAADMKKQKGEVTVLELAGKMESELLLFLNIDKFVNILRVEITSVETLKPDSVKKSTAYALLRYKNNKTGEFLFDPTLIEAVQRAFIGIDGDSALYSGQQGRLAVASAAPLVVGGLYFINDEELADWELFRTKQVTSFDAVETIFGQALNSKDYVAFDMATRDSIYARFNLYAVENYHTASIHEIEALRRFDVQYYITGTFKRIGQGAEIELILSEIISGKLHAIRYEKALLAEDKLDDFRENLSNITAALLNISDK